MSCNNVQILNFNHNIVEVGPDNKIVITDQIKCNSITIPQPVTNILQINSPGPQGITGPQGPAGPLADIGGSTTQIQYNNNNSFGGVSTLTYNGSSLVTATNINATGSFIGIFAEYVTTTTVGNTDPETFGLPTDLTITQSGTYIIIDVYTGTTGYIYFPNPATHTGEKIRIQKWYTVYKDHVTLEDYEIHDGMGLELYYN